MDNVRGIIVFFFNLRVNTVVIMFRSVTAQLCLYPLKSCFDQTKCIYGRSQGRFFSHRRLKSKKRRGKAWGRTEPFKLMLQKGRQIDASCLAWWRLYILSLQLLQAKGTFYAISPSKLNVFGAINVTWQLLLLSITSGHMSTNVLIAELIFCLVVW